MARRPDSTRSEQGGAPVVSMNITDVRREPQTMEGFAPITVASDRGEIEMRYYPAAGATRGAIFVGGAGGGFDTPVRGSLYPRLCGELQREQVAGLRVRFRYPNDLEECVLDVLAGISVLGAEGVESVALVGHSFGGAVVIQAAAQSEVVRTCVPMSTQTYGAEPAATLGPRCSLLIVHGLADEVLPPSCSEYVYHIAREPKELLLKAGARHGLDEWADELPQILREWIVTQLRA